jgi:hypothetical protein
MTRSVLGVVDALASIVARRPVKLRAKVSPEGLLRGEIDVLTAEVREIPVAKLVVERLVIRAEHVRIRPGLPPRLQAGAVGCKAVVAQAAIERWTHTLLPIRLSLTREGIVANTGLGGVRMGEMLTEIEAVGPMLRLRPTRARILGVQAPGVGLLPGYLPLPPMPAGARLERIEHRDGEVAAYIDLGAVDLPLTPGLGRRLRKRFSVG